MPKHKSTGWASRSCLRCEVARTDTIRSNYTRVFRRTAQEDTHVQLQKSGTALVGLLVLVVTLVALVPLVSRGQVNKGNGPPTQDVSVVNTPLPVTGTVSVSNLGDSPLPVRDVDNPARQPFQLSNQLPTGNFLVPAGKRFVIEYFSARAITTADNNCTLAALIISTQTNSPPLPGAPLTKDHYFTPTPTTTNLTTNVFVVSQPTRIYADPGTIIGGEVDFRGSACAAAINFADITFSGYLVDVP